MEALQKVIQDKARELLASQQVVCVLGYERATDGLTARPFFAYSPEEAERLIFDQTCVHNLAKYLLNWRDKPTAIVAKPCDARAINLLLQEKQIKRDKVYILGVVCLGMAQTAWNFVGPLQERCQGCPQHNPPVYDFLVGEPVAEALATSMPPDPGVARLEGLSAEAKQAFWAEHFQRCIRCYACRQVCPGCYCTECFADQLDPLWLGIRIAPTENHMWNLVRAFHLAGRCIQCGECQRVCPVNIPLMLLNDKLTQQVGQLFQFQPGMSAEALPPFATFKKDEHLGIE